MVKKVGPFELGKCVGKGATASVYLAHEPIRRKDVAIKQLKHSENSRRTIAHEVPKAAPASSAASPPPHNCPCLVGAEAASPSWCVQPVSLPSPVRWTRGLHTPACHRASERAAGLCAFMLARWAPFFPCCPRLKR